MDEPIPGLGELTGAESELEKAVCRSLAALTEAGRLTEADAGRAQVAIELARVITTKRLTGRMSTLASDARLLVEILTPASDGAGIDEQLRQALAEWSHQ